MALWKEAQLRGIRRLRRALVPALLVTAAATLLRAPPVRADQVADEKAAHEAYERGARAFGQGNYALAAAELARADQLQPAPAALEAALKAAILAGDAVLAMTLSERAAARPANAGVSAQVTRAKERFAQKVARLTLRCPEACAAKVGNDPVPTGVARYYLAGNHVIEITSPVGGPPELYPVQLPGGGAIEWEPPAAASPPPVAAKAPVATSVVGPVSPPAPPVAPPPSRLPVVLFAGGAALTVVAGAFTVGFGVDTLAQHDAFVAAPTNVGSAAGQDAQLRTNIFAGVTAASAVAAAILGYLAFRAPASAARAPLSAPSLAWVPVPAWQHRPAPGALGPRL